MNKQHYDAGMFYGVPDLRFRLKRSSGVAVHSKLQRTRFIDQTDIVKFLEMVVSDPALSEGLEPIPAEVSDFQAAAVDTEAVQLEDGTWVTDMTIREAWYDDGNCGYDLLPEAKGDEAKASSLMASVKPRTVTQWWLCPDKELVETMESYRLVTVSSADGRSKWFATYDEAPKEDFWETSIGFCLSFLLDLGGT